MAEEYDVIVVGGGVAGLTAGLFSVRLGVKTVLLEKLLVGGHIINADIIENYPGFPEGVKGYDLVIAMQRQAKSFGLEINQTEAEGVRKEGSQFILDTQDGEYQAKALIIASGGRRNRLGVPGEDALEGRGVSYCATCDGDFYRDKDVAVVGGGDAAVDEALYLANLCRGVTLVHRREQLRAGKILQDRALSNPKMHFLWNTQVERILGEEEVRGIAVRHTTSGEVNDLPVSGVFVYVGITPETGWLKGLVPTDLMGHIVVDLQMRTQVPGIFAAGEVRQHSARQIVTVAGDGATAVLSAFRYLRGEK